MPRRGYSPTPFFEVNLETEDEEVLKRLSGKEAIAAFNKITEESGEVVARVAMKRMSDMLKPGHRFNVGASGEASENFQTELISRGAISRWAVTSKGLTKANLFIRTGFKGTYGKDEAKWPPEQNIKWWAAYKGVALHANTDDKPTKIIRSKSKYGKPYVRAYKAKSTSEEALWAIRRKLAFTGSKNSNWTDLYPKGQGRFDYVVYTVKQEDYLAKALDSVGNAALIAFIDYVNKSRNYTGRVLEISGYRSQVA